MQSLKRVVCGALVVTSAAVVTTSSALADPPKGVVPAPSAIVGVGSDTTEQVMQVLSTKYNATKPANKLYSFNATGTAKIRPKRGGAVIPRPDGSSAGIAAMAKNQKVSGNFLLDFARSSRARDTSSDPSTFKFVRFGQDAVTWAAGPNTHAPRSLTTAQLTRIFKCTVRNWKALGGTNGTIKPVLPQTGSGTRAFFLGALGMTDSQVGGCVTQGVQENEGSAAVYRNFPRVVVAPYSVSKYIAQVFNHHQDVHGKLALHRIAGVAPTRGTGTNTVINARFPAHWKRFLYNVLRQSAMATTRIRRVFGPKGWICTSAAAKATLKSYGIRSLGSQCGAVS